MMVSIVPTLLLLDCLTAVSVLASSPSSTSSSSSSTSSTSSASPSPSSSTPSSSSSTSSSCDSEKLVVYKMLFTTYWDRETFPRQYPEWRPPAQWSKLIGFSHDPSYNLFTMGQPASESLKQFAETGETDLLDKQSIDLKNGAALLDGFTAPPIEQGKGRSKAKLFVDGNHTLVSLISKLIPSPDWFVGVDSLDLCESGRFLDSITVEVDPLDAGTDNGFTFTAPNWPTTPQGIIFKITNTYPTHPAGSFHYPELSSLPTIATFTFQKEKEYELSEVFHIGTDNLGEELLTMEHVNRYSYSIVKEDEEDVVKTDDAVIDFVPKERSDTIIAEDHDDNNYGLDDGDDNQTEEVEKNEYAGLKEDLNEILSNEISRHHRQRHHGSGRGLKSAIKAFRSTNKRGYHASTGPTDFFKKKYKSGLLENAQEKLFKKKNFYEKILESYHARRSSKGLSESLAKKLARRKMRRLRKRKSNKHRHPRHCKVSEWTSWGPCSKSCGIGEAKRMREILKEPKRGGKACPALQDVKWCGSARNCRENYFNW